MAVERNGQRPTATFKAKFLPENIIAFEGDKNDSPCAVYYRKLNENEASVWTEVPEGSEMCTDFIMYKIK
ncbi:MAG: hypothetical protein HUK15_00460 [Bacteroidales bacterium]|nr:hypothetical protein [Bacteroidales bacterium]